MTNKKNRNISANSRAISILVFALSALCVGLLLGGCGDNGLVPTGTDSEDNVSFFDLPYDGDAVAKRADIAETQVNYVESHLSTGSGGVIPLGADENVEAFIVLPNSFPADTTFTVEVTKMVTTDGEMPVVYEFGPDGLQFSRPALLRLNVAEMFGRNVSSVKLYRLVEQYNTWEYVATYDADDQGYVYASVEHFSSYGTVGGGTDSAK